MFLLKLNKVWMLSLVLRTVILSQDYSQFNRLLGSFDYFSFLLNTESSFNRSS